MDAVGAFSRGISSASRFVDRTSSRIENGIGKLASGQAVVRAADDVARLAIGTRLAATTATLSNLTTNLNKAASQAQAADAGINVIQSSLLRAYSLAVQSSSPNLSDAERALLQVEFAGILSEIDRQAKDAELGGVQLLDTEFVPIFVSSDFDDGVLPTDTFLRSSGGASVFIDNGRARLLDGADGNAVGALVNDTAFLTEGGLEARFTLLTGGTISGGANLFGGGMSFFLVDAEQFDAATSALGPTSSTNLGYRGLTGGFIGIGFDSFGAYITPEFGATRDVVAVRGPESQGNQLLGNTFVDLTPFGGLDGAGDAPPQPLLERQVELSISADFIVNVSITFEETGQTVQVLDNFDLGSSLPAADRPESVKFGFAATVAGRRNNFLIDNLEVLASIDVRARMEAARKTLRATDDIDPDLQLALPLYDATLEGLTLQDTSIETQTRAEAAIGRLEFALDQTTDARAVLGAAGFVYDAATNNLLDKVNSLDKARGGVMDLDVARELGRMISRQAAQAAGIAVLSQSDQAKRTFAATLRQMIGESSIPIDV